MPGFYVYALVDRAVPVFQRAGRKIEFVRAGTFYAAVERMAGRPAVSEAALRAQHDIVTRIAGKADAVLPARFGSFVDAIELQRVLVLRREPIERALALVAGRVQMTIRLSGRAISAEQARAPRTSGRASSGTSYLHERKAATLAWLPPEIIDPLNRAVQALVVAAKTERGSGDTVALYHLIEPADEKKYRRAVGRVTLPDDDLAFRVTGPWPAFAFAPELWP